MTATLSSSPAETASSCSSISKPAKSWIVLPGDIAPRVDEIAYDPGTRRVYCGVRHRRDFRRTIRRVLNVGGVTPLGDVPSAPGAHSIAVDPKTHKVWIVFAKDNKPYVQSFLDGRH